MKTTILFLCTGNSCRSQMSERLHAGFDAPPALPKRSRTEEETLSHYRRVRDEIRGFIGTIPDGLANTGT